MFPLMKWIFRLNYWRLSGFDSWVVQEQVRTGARKASLDAFTALYTRCDTPVNGGRAEGSRTPVRGETSGALLYTESRLEGFQVLSQ